MCLACGGHPGCRGEGHLAARKERPVIRRSANTRTLWAMHELVPPGRMPGRRDAISVRQVVCLERSSASLLPLLPKKGGEGRGEEAVLFPLSPALSPLVP